ncbi:hypothetical protein [Streptomyces sp. NBC_01358]|uniref:hypothetical protein n=1 Tax=Streptomyces sp. NBC_01358 TaxID=2903837 RepID=UPI002E36987F|nr:hypothetical protein [Streptomyces sp. NBC_01358]
MDPAPEHMSSRTVAAWTVALAALGGLTGFVWGGGFLAVTCGLSLAGGGALKAVLSHRRTVATARGDRAAGTAAPGHGDGAADTMMLGIHAYKHSVFPLSGPGAVDPAECIARREEAYRLTAAAGIPHHIREAAAATLEAIDGGCERAALSAVEDLRGAIRKRHCDL